MPDISEILKKAKRRQKSVHLCLAGDLVAELEELERQLSEAGDAWSPDSLAATDPRVALAKKVAAARDKVRKSYTEFRFQSLGDKGWSDLLAEHPGKEQGHAWDPDTFPKALIAASAVDPEMLPEQVSELFEILNEGQREQLFQCAFDVNREAPGIPFSLSASGILEALTAGK
ncbi:hypothetical protein [Streptomyces nymphaeiformis]|uniref:Uncharacterized protein n=1 Tax=Streptomyces nymphaeiformis TaxID=2663842 RepID=A0A7W7XED9_9ACTN|nr:hypothetical protein [Streptomyces nymphaeiformis]MBB4985037.1 hypothetical protein [Streptomyces nymphaeiformis]